MKHLVLYDGDCAFCQRAVRFIYRHDSEKHFAFAPLQGETAKQFLTAPPNLDTVILIENYKTHPQQHLYAKASFRALWLLGGLWTLPGSLYFLPAPLIDWGYRLVARHRPSTCPLPTPEDTSRFLP